MTIVAALLAAALVAVVWLLLRHQQHAERAWEAERRELLNRIQRPEQIPLPDAPDFVLPEPEDDESALVGTVAEPEEAEQQ